MIGVYCCRTVFVDFVVFVVVVVFVVFRIVLILAGTASVLIGLFVEIANEFGDCVGPSTFLYGNSESSKGIKKKIYTQHNVETTWSYYNKFTQEVFGSER